MVLKLLIEADEQNYLLPLLLWQIFFPLIPNFGVEIFLDLSLFILFYDKAPIMMPLIYYN